jgi:hypothetical protein
LARVAEGAPVPQAGHRRVQDADDEGGIDVYFIPIRPGTYEFFVENYRESGMLGTFEIR